MKRILTLILALITVFAFTACDDKGGEKPTIYYAYHSHLYYAVETFTNYEFSVIIDGDMTRSTESDDDGDVWEVEYYKKGSPSAFKFKNEIEEMYFTCDESGKLTKVE